MVRKGSLLWLLTFASEEYGNHQLRHCLTFVSLTLTPSFTFNTLLMLSLIQRKKRQYSQAVEAQHSSFSPFVISVDGVLAREARFFVKCIAEKETLWNKASHTVRSWDGMVLGKIVLCSAMANQTLLVWIKKEMKKWFWHTWWSLLLRCFGALTYYCRCCCSRCCYYSANYLIFICLLLLPYFALCCLAMSYSG